MVDLSDDKRWEIDQVIMKWWDAKAGQEKKRCELDCYKLFKTVDYDDNFVVYLRENGAEELADGMKHFEDVFHKVPHEHEQRKAA